MSDEKVLFLYHDPCTDGLMSRVIAQIYFKTRKEKVSYVGANPSTLHADIEKILQLQRYDTIYAFDVSITPFIFQKMKDVAQKVIVYDHHESTQKAFVGQETSGVFFDNSRCGAQLAWDYFFPGKETPSIVSYIQVRDLWLFDKKGDLPGSKEITTFLYDQVFALPFGNPSNYECLLSIQDEKTYFENALEKGAVILRQTEKRLQEICSQIQFRKIVIGDKELVAGVIASNVLGSEIGNYIVKNCPSVDFALIWCLDGNSRLRISLRSDSARCNVNDVAKYLWNGGGHAAAAGALLSDETSQVTFLQTFVNPFHQ